MSTRVPWRADAAACFGWSARAWHRPWQQFLSSQPNMCHASGLEVGAGRHSSLTPLMLDFVQQVECSVYDEAILPQVKARLTRQLSPERLTRVQFTQQDLRRLEGRWDVIVLKSVLGGVFRLHNSTLEDVRDAIRNLRTEHLKPGGMLVTLDNGRTALEPMLAGFGARRNGWRFFSPGDFPPADARFSFGFLSVASAQTRLGLLGRWLDDAAFQFDRCLQPWVTRHSVHLHVYRSLSP